MIEIVAVAVVALGASALTLFSGFGLGTLLLPVFALFFPVEIAVAATAVVHLAGNAAKIAMLGRFADRTVLRRFLFPAVMASLLGARQLTRLSALPPVVSYELFGRVHAVTWVGFVIGVLVVGFALWEAVPGAKDWTVDPRYLAVGGGLTGFFGGLSGHQGALRSAFLVRCGLDARAFIGTGVVVAVMVDITRLALYGHDIGFAALHGRWPPVLAGMAAAIAGVVLARRFLHKVSMASVRRLVAVMLVLIGLAMATGLV